MDIAIPFDPIEGNMEVLEHVLGEWHVLRDGDEYYLDVRTGLFGYGFWLLMRLNEAEMDAYQKHRKAFIRPLVEAVLERPQFYFLRNESIEMQRLAFDAVTTWRHGPRRPRV